MLPMQTIEQSPITNLKKAMTLEEIYQNAANVECPDSFPENLSIGECITKDPRGYHLVVYDPVTSFCDALSSIREIKDSCDIHCYTHGIQLHVGNIYLNIHNSQILTVEIAHIDEIVEIDRAESRSEKVKLGLLVGGVVGAAAGLATSFGKKQKRIVEDVLIIIYWDIKTKKKQILFLSYNKGFSTPGLQSFVNLWKEQVEINQKNNRLPSSNEMAGSYAQDGGCLGVIALIVALTSSLCILL